MKTLHLLAAAALVAISPVLAEAPRVYPKGSLPADSRLQPLKDLNGFFPFEVPETLEAWETRAEKLRQRVLVANGLWPMPEKTPLNATIHGKVERPGFTAEKVYFESLPGFYVTGLLFRPEKPASGKLPAVLCPHGHGGRLQSHSVENVRKYIATGGERFEDSGRMPKVARAATLARLGCVVFLYDMIGYADNTQLSFELGHRFAKQRPDFESEESWGLYSAQAELQLQSIFGLQTWNSIRALDFLESLPDVDAKRLAVTGGSGGGTQTIMLGAIDPRPVAGFPNGMVSSSMQGGCTCENASLLRIGTGNVELAALFAPRPQGMTAANDWTREMLVPGKGFPELQKLYALYGKKDHVICPDLLHYPHNYNYVTRAIMYSWFNKHLKLGLPEPVIEEDFKLLSAEEHAVWNDAHPKPEGGDAFERKLTRWIADRDQKLLAAMTEDERRKVVRAAWRTMIGRELPKAGDVEFADGKLRFKPAGEEIPALKAGPDNAKTAVIWVDGGGKDALHDNSGKLTEKAQKLVDGGSLLVTADLFGQGEFLADGNSPAKTRTVANKREFAGYTHGYNHSLFARRTHDILTLIAFARKTAPNAKIRLIGTNGAGIHVAAACAVAGDALDSATAETGGFRFAAIKSYRHPDFIPGAVKYGDLAGLLSVGGQVLTAVDTIDEKALARLAN